MTKLGLIVRSIYIVLVVLHFFAATALAQRTGDVLVVDVEGPVTPIMLSFIERAIAEADVRNAEALIIRLDTPGGEVQLTRQIIQAIISSDVPVVVYVWPPGGFAASAGTFITLAAHGAAMAPNTSIGAASPVSLDGAAIDDTARAKTENILIAEMKSLADRRGSAAVEWAQGAITEAKAANAEEALELGVIDFIAKDLDDLVSQLDGFTVEVLGDQITLATKNAPVSFLEATAIEQFLSVIGDPRVAILLGSIGFLAIVYEIINPGGYMSGIVGAILLLISMYGIGQLPVNYAGVALIVLGLGLFVAELFTPTFGALTVVGVVAFIFGGLILFNTNEFAYQLPLTSIVGIPVSLALVFMFGLRKVLQSRNIQPVTGGEGLIGSRGTVKVALDPQGIILVWGERWQATSIDGEAIATGEQVQVTDRDGFHLKVKKVASS